MTSKEWGVAFRNHPHILHQGPMSESAAKAWVADWDKEVLAENKGVGIGMFAVINREVGEWQIADE